MCPVHVSQHLGRNVHRNVSVTLHVTLCVSQGHVVCMSQCVCHRVYETRVLMCISRCLVWYVQWCVMKMHVLQLVLRLRFITFG